MQRIIQRWMYFGAGATAAMLLFGLPAMTMQTAGRVIAQGNDTATVQRTALETSIESSGTIEPQRTVYLAFGSGGNVETLDVAVGDTVTTGQTLAAIDTSDLEYQIALQEQSLIVQQASYDQLVEDPSASEIAQAESSLRSAQSQLVQAQNSLETAPNQETINCSSVEDAQESLENAQDDYDDYVNEGYEWDATFVPNANSDQAVVLRDAQSSLAVAEAQCDNTDPDAQYEFSVTAAQASVDQAQAALDDLLQGPSEEEVASAQAQLAQTQLQLENARADLEDALIVAPFDGVVDAVEIVVGQRVQSGTNAIRLQDNSQLHIDVEVDELDIPQVQVGQVAYVVPAALDDVQFTGQVARIAPAGEEVDGIVTYNVRVELTATEDAPIYVGMTTDVEIVISSEGDVLAVPTEAIQRDGTQEFVQVQNADGSLADISVTTGQTVDDLTEISGADLEEGMVVIIPTQEASAQAGGFGAPFGGG